MSAGLTVAEVLNAAADLIEPEGAWTQGTTARSKQGFPTNYHSPDAVCFCAVGAVWRSSKGTGLTMKADRALRRHLGIVAVGNWNDAPERTQIEVVAALRAAAALAVQP